MIEKEPVSIEGLTKAYFGECALCLQAAYPDPTELKQPISRDEMLVWLHLLADEFMEKMVAAGYFTEKTTWEYNQAGFVEMEQIYIAHNGVLTALAPECKEFRQTAWEGVKGYKESDEVKACRAALAEYQTAQQGVSPLGHTPLFKKLKDEVAKAGLKLEDFLEINEVLP